VGPCPIRSCSRQSGSRSGSAPGRRLHERISIGDDPFARLGLAFLGQAYDVIERRPVRWRCRCSREKAWTGVSLLGPDALQEMIAADAGARVNCDFCSTTNAFSSTELEAILEDRVRGGRWSDDPAD
jgi:hypothetical protein